ncbi:MAG: 2TM domain-containing protein [Flavobacteriaceae bacterium]|nr:2TM domain-containing protein [Flavobacteriaceae bacterium]
MKENDQYKLHEKARKRIKQKKQLYFHFILFLVGSIFLVILNKVIKFKPEYDWFAWAILVWLFSLTIHTINVFFMKRFFGKDWARIETEKLIEKHQEKVEELEKRLDEKGVFISDTSGEEIKF